LITRFFVKLKSKSQKMTSSNKVKRLSKIAREFNVGISTIVEFLHGKNIEIENSPNTKISPEAYSLLSKEFNVDSKLKAEAKKIDIGKNRGKQEKISIEDDAENEQPTKAEIVNQESKTETSTKVSEEKHTEEKVVDVVPKDTVKVKVVGKIDIEKNKKSEEKPSEEDTDKIVAKTEEKKKENDIDTTEKQEIEKKEQKKDSSKKNAEKSLNEKRKDVNSEPKEKKKSEKEKIDKKPKTVSKVKPEKPKESKPETAEKKEVKDTEIKTQVTQLDTPKVIGKIDLNNLNQKTRPSRKTKEEKAKERKERENAKKENQKGDKNTTGKNTDASSESAKKKKKRKRIKKDRVDINTASTSADKNKKNKFNKKNQKRKPIKHEVNEEDVQKQIKETLARLTGSKSKNKAAKYRRDKRDSVVKKAQDDLAKIELEKNILKVTEFVSVNELANMMDVNVNEVISTCMSLGLFVSINQRLDAETMALVADEFSYKVEFVSADVLDSIAEEDEEDKEEELQSRPPIVTVMGHVDHGKTSLLDYIRKANVISGEAGGITQHIGAYSVTLEGGQKITFLDTPGHEAFTAMRARGAQVTDIAIIIVAADDKIMPQTIEAINHAQAAGVPLVFAINKIDKPGANPERIKEELANMNLLVEEWGGKYQSQDISAKNGINIEELLEKVLLEAEMLDLKANPNRKALGTVIEASLDKGRGYVATVLVQKGTLKIGDVILAGQHTGHIKAMYNERNEQIKEAGPSSPVLILGLNGAPQAGDKFNVMDSDREAKEIATRRQQLAREQGFRTQKHITLDEIGRRIAVGNFQELNVIVKGDVDGSIEALSDSLIKLSTDEIQVNVKHKAVGQISESDVLLASASDAIIIGFQVRPSLAARKLAEKEQIDIRLYSVIYDAINEIKDAMEGMLSPEVKEEITATVEVRETFKITKVGTIAGCFVREGKIKRSSKVRVIRDGIVVYTGELGSLKRFKDDAKEVTAGLECGLNIDKYNDVKVGDIIEAYEEVEIKRTL
jgi:translation initiation factor IF-2